jgi:hypothetical protein
VNKYLSLIFYIAGSLCFLAGSIVALIREVRS